MIKLLIGRAAQFLISLLGVRLITTLLTPDDVGMVALWVAMIAGFAMLFLNPVGMYINRNLNSWVEFGSLKKNMVLFLFYICALGLISMCLVVAFGSVINFDFRTTLPWLCLFIFVSLTFGTINQVLTSFFSLLHKDYQFLLLTLGAVSSGLLIATMFTVFAREQLSELWFLGTLLGQALFALIGTRLFLVSIVKNEKISFDDFRQLSLTQAKKLMEFCLPIAVASTLSWVQFQGYRFYVADVIGLNEFGLFVAGYGLASSITFAFDQVLTSWFQPSLYRMANSDSEHAIRKAWGAYSQLMLSASILGLATLILFSDTLGLIVFGYAFSGSITYLKLGAVAEFFRAVISIFGLLPQLQMKTKNLIYPGLLGVSTTMVLLFSTVKHFGGTTIPLSIAAGSLVNICAIFIFSKREYSNNLNFDIKKQALLFLTVPTAYFVAGASNSFVTGTMSSTTFIILFSVAILLPSFYIFVIKPGSDLRNNALSPIK